MATSSESGSGDTRLSLDIRDPGVKLHGLPRGVRVLVFGKVNGQDCVLTANEEGVADMSNGNSAPAPRELEGVPISPGTEFQSGDGAVVVGCVQVHIGKGANREDLPPEIAALAADAVQPGSGRNLSFGESGRVL